MVQNRRLLVAAWSMMAVAVLTAVACDVTKPSAPAQLARVLWHKQQGRRVKGAGESTSYPDVPGIPGDGALSVRYDDDKARHLGVRCLGSDDECPVDELAPHRRLLRAEPGGRWPIKYYQLQGGPLDGCVQRVETRSSISVATPAYAEIEWGIHTATPAR